MKMTQTNKREAAAASAASVAMKLWTMIISAKDGGTV